MAIESRYTLRVLKRIYILFQSRTWRVNPLREILQCNKGINSITHSNRENLIVDARTKCRRPRIPETFDMAVINLNVTVF